MNYIKSFNFLKTLPKKLNLFYEKKKKITLKTNNKSKSKINYDPVTNIDLAFERYIRRLISNKFPEDSIIGEEFKNKTSLNNLKWSIDPIDGTKAFLLGAPTWSNLIGLSYQNKSLIGLANFPELNKHYINDKKKSYKVIGKKKESFKSFKY